MITMSRRNGNEEEIEWLPKTELGKKVMAGEIEDIESVFQSQSPLLEAEIVDYLVPNLEDEIILIGGTPGKGGGKRRIVSKRTSRMHKSGRRFKTKCMAAVGNKNGLIGLAEGSGSDTRDSIDKAIKNAKLNLIAIRRGCGSWECAGKEPHSVPFRTQGKSGSVEAEVLPAPKGIGLCASSEVKKLLELAGIKDVWIKTRGKTRTRENLLKSVFNALKNLAELKVGKETKKNIKLAAGQN